MGPNAKFRGKSATPVPYQMILDGTSSPALVTDGQWRIVALNPQAEQLLGCSSCKAEGQSPHTLLCGHDRFGNRFCKEQCVVGKMAQPVEPMYPFELDVVSAVGELIRSVCSVIALRDGRESRIVHILTPMPQANGGDGSTPSGADAARRYGLTAREREVLAMLAKGDDCHRIADQLFISLATVRNHVHSFLRKMEVHSQVEAVALAYREGLI